MLFFLAAHLIFEHETPACAPTADIRAKRGSSEMLSGAPCLQEGTWGSFTLLFFKIRRLY